MNASNSLISIIVPVYRTKEYLEQCVQSLRAQSYTNLEIILVDDGSPDECPALCDAYASQDKRILVVHKKMEDFPLRERLAFNKPLAITL